MGNLKFNPTPLSGAFIIDLNPFQDERGWFSRVFCKEEFEQINHRKDWVQMNHSFTLKKGSIRGMHYQQPPYAEVKLVRCIVGEVFDVIVDLRIESPTFLKWWGVNLSSANKKMIYIPEGFAHGFQTLQENSELLYHHTEFYNNKYERGIKFDDPLLSIHWPLPYGQLSERDLNHPKLNKSFEGLKI